MRVVATIPVGTRPIGVAAGFDHIFVTNGDDDSLSVIDAKTNTLINTVKVGARPAGVATDPQVGVFVANSGNGTVSLPKGDRPPGYRHPSSIQPLDRCRSPPGGCGEQSWPGQGLCDQPR